MSSVHLGAPSEFVTAAASARSIRFAAYTLRPGSVKTALLDAAKRGADVHVRLDGWPYDDAAHTIQKQNRATLAEMRRAGIDAVENHNYHLKFCTWHMKAAVIDDRTAFLDDRNWPDDGRDTIVVTSEPEDVRTVAAALRAGARNGGAGDNDHLWTIKQTALLNEEALIRNTPSHEIAVESESFGRGKIAHALIDRSMAGDHVRLLISESDAKPNLAPTLQKLVDAGVAIRIGPDDEKIAVCGTEAWVGSANATMANHLPDWGMRTNAPEIVEVLRARYERNWSAAHPLA